MTYASGLEVLVEKVVKGRVAISLEGHTFELEDACLLFSGRNGLQVRRMFIPPNEKFVLLADELHGESDEERIFRESHRLVDLINAALFLYNPLRHPITCSGINHRQAANGNWGATVNVSGIALGRARAQGVSKSAAQESAARSVLLASQDELPMSVFRLVRGIPDWFDLYKAYEIMRDEINRSLGQNQETKIGWPDCEDFHRSAQVFRHGPKSKWAGKTPETAMALADARALVRILLEKWLAWRESLK